MRGYSIADLQNAGLAVGAQVSNLIARPAFGCRRFPIGGASKSKRVAPRKGSRKNGLRRHSIWHTLICDSRIGDNRFKPSGSAVMKESTLADLVIREPVPAELERAVYLFQNVRLRPQARIFVAVRSRPVERFVAAVAWWSEWNVGRFQLACSPGMIRDEVCALLIDQVSQRARIAGKQSLQYGELLADKSDWIELLARQGFSLLRSERFFEVPGLPAWTRTVEAFEKYKSKLPPGWRTESIRQHAPETILELIAPYRLMTPEELRDHWRADSAFGFELDLSSTLFDGSQPIGTFLARRVRDSLCVDVRVVRAENRLLDSLGNVCLLYHVAKRRRPDEGINHLQFRGGATEHRETANLAMRMDGRELPARHVFSKAL